MRRDFQAARKGLRTDHVLFRLWQKGKLLGIWDPASIDLSRDARDWDEMSAAERELVLNVGALFLSGEEAVTLDLLPMLKVAADQGRLEEEIYLTNFLWEEAKHVEFFHRCLREITRGQSDLSRFHLDNYRAIFYDALPRAMNRLYTDTSPSAQAEAAVTYNMIVEGVLAETGYHGWHEALVRSRLLPGMSAGMVHVQRDESRHLRFGVYTISRLVAEHGDEAWEAVERKMAELLPPAIGIINDLFDYHESAFGAVAFGLKREDFVDYAVTQFQKRLDRIEKAKGMRVEQVLFGADVEDEAEGGGGHSSAAQSQ